MTKLCNYVKVDVQTFDNKRKLSVTVGANEPMELEHEEALEFAYELGVEEGYSRYVRAEEILVFGQNQLCERTYYFKK